MLEMSGDEEEFEELARLDDVVEEALGTVRRVRKYKG